MIAQLQADNKAAMDKYEAESKELRMNTALKLKLALLQLLFLNQSLYQVKAVVQAVTFRLSGLEGRIECLLK
ncbi:hypothetical protein PAALTS15_15361 [Paenibacillus alvei TS-15]|uniref:Uncharacterized protein n=1 Tax=Paenibacillus alvei TS-15 TaxID=1117108 RepID=S9SQZ3_PAEAL|nr:hypothetical protein [Paenibacillus alvei]EPY06538.1 hypothetical protein PAALTS15_15361 [Paenibacillus alvei TS-15]